MGLTTEGRINFARNEIDVSGTFVPAYSVNSLLNKIPLVGVLLGGGQNEGVFGISYRVRGPINAPQVSINPLSAIAPGILAQDHRRGRPDRLAGQVHARRCGGHDAGPTLSAQPFLWRWPRCENRSRRMG